MRHFSSLCFCLVLLASPEVTAQFQKRAVADTLGTRVSNYKHGPGAMWFEGNLVFSAASGDTPERQIYEYEQREVDALLKRDTAELRKLWQRDFTQDEPAHKFVNGRSRLPRYVSLYRTYEKVTRAGGAIFTSGEEISTELDERGRMEAPVKRRFFHTWSFIDGQWKLAGRSHTAVRE